MTSSKQSGFALPFAQTILFLCLVVLLSWPAAGHAVQPEVWQPWEGPPLNSTKSPFYANPYTEVQLKIEYYKSTTLPPAGTTPNHTGLAFWDSGTTFKFRTKFPSTGTWWWRTTCLAGCAGDTGLAPQTGGPITINANTSTANPLYQNGAVRVATLGTDPPNLSRYLVHDNGTPFFWQGDTTWSGAWYANATPWNTYLTDRSNKKFSVIQTSLPSGNVTCPETQPKNQAGQRPFENTSANCDLATFVFPNETQKPNATFWASFDARIKAANDQGMLVVVIGAMKRTVEKVTKTDTTTAELKWPTLAASQAYARYVAARFSGYHVLLSPSFDELPTNAQISALPADGSCSAVTCSGSVVTSNIDRACRTRCIGLELKSASGGQAGRPLLTAHSGGACKDENPCRADVWYEKLQKESWTDLILFQSGQSSEALPDTAKQLQMLTERARERPLHLYNDVLSPIKPNVNGEGIYENGSGNYVADRAIQVGYLSMLSGAFGYTVGVGGIWDWTNSANTNTAASVRMQHLGTLFRSLPWQRLKPEHTRILNQVSDVCPYPPQNPDLCFSLPGPCNCMVHDKMKALAFDTSGRYGLVYLPATAASLQFDNNGWTNYPSFLFYWFDPRNGCVRAATAPSCSGTTCTINSYDSTKDWIFLMKLSTVGGTGPFPPTCSP
jgi:hypothetical protein